MKEMKKSDESTIKIALEFSNRIIATLRESFLVLDKNLRIISANQAFYTTFKTAEKDTLGRPLSDLGDGQWNIPKLLQLLKEIVPEKKAVKDYEIEHKFEQIGQRVMILNACQLSVHKKIAGILAAGIIKEEDDKDEEELILLAIEDISDCKQAENALSELLKIAKIGSWEYDVASDKFIFNDKFYELLRTTAELEGGYLMSSEQYANRFIPQAEQSLVGDGIKKLLETTDPNYSTDMIHRVIFADGKPGWLQVRIRITKDEQGLTVKTHGVNQDITDIKKSEESLKESEKRYRQLFESSYDALMTLEPPQWNFSSCNPATLKMFKCGDEKEFCSFPPSRLSPEFQPDGRLSSDKAKEMIQIALLKGANIFEWTHKKTTGENFLANVLLTKVNIFGKEIIQATVRDISEHKKLEEEIVKSDKLESIGILAGGIAHDFNNIMTHILGNINIVKELTKSNSEASEMLTDAEKGVAMATSLTRQLLTFAKGGEPIKKVASIAGIVKDSADFALRGSTCKAEFSVIEGIWAAEVDTDQIKQVIDNLVINARQAMPVGGIINVSIENISIPKENPYLLTEGSYIDISVQDHGIGIPKEYISKIFDPYFTTKQMGNGLGLASVYSIIKKHSGHISVYSEPGKGTLFHIYLPAMKGMVAESNMENHKILEGSGRILIMDDDEPVREMLGRMLKRLGYDVLFAENGEEALKEYKKAGDSPKPIDLVILDLTVQAGMGGKELFEELKKINPGIKAIASSGYSDDVTAAKHKNIGFKEFLGKPYNFAKLSQIVAGAIK